MSDNQWPGIPKTAHALYTLKVKDYILKGDPTSEDEFKAQFRKFNGDTQITDPTQWGVTWEQIQTEKNRLLAEYNAKEYQRKRLNEYPHIVDQLDMLYWDKKNGTNTWEQAIDKVKSDNPK